MKNISFNINIKLESRIKTYDYVRHCFKKVSPYPLPLCKQKALALVSPRDKYSRMSPSKTCNIYIVVPNIYMITATRLLTYLGSTRKRSL